MEGTSPLSVEGGTQGSDVVVVIAGRFREGRTCAPCEGAECRIKRIPVMLAREVISAVTRVFGFDLKGND
jgi:hypothetical protein